MSEFLTHLASVALGRPVPGAAGPALPPRYGALEAGGPIPGTEDAGAEPGATPWTASPRAAAAGFAGAAGESVRGAAPPVSPPGEPAPRPAAEAFAAPISTASRQGAPRPADVRPRRSPRSPARAAEPSEIPSTNSRELQGDVPAPTPPSPAEALIRPQVAGPLRVAAVGGPRQAPAPSPSAPTPIAPLSDGAVAGRTRAGRAPPPVIHVTIDRIDVRAPAQSRPVPTARRAPAEPSLSLSDFLAAGSPRPRQ